VFCCRCPKGALHVSFDNRISDEDPDQDA
jgi:hypothetical protein